MRVFMVDPSPEGGIAHYTYNLANALTTYEDITLYGPTRYELKDFPRRFSLKPVFGTGVPLHLIGNLNTFLHTVMEKPDILHIEWFTMPETDFLNTKIIKNLSGIPLCYTAHNVLPHEFKKEDMMLYKKIYELFDCMIVHSKNDVEDLKKTFDIGRDKIRYIPHGNYLFLSERYPPLERTLSRKKLKISEGSFTILFFGLIRDYKGLDILLRSTGEILSESPDMDIRLLIAGNAPAGFGKYERLIKQLKIEKSVIKYIQYIPFEQVPLFFSSADVVALPYRKIYQSGVVQLSYAYKKPVIASATGGVAEAVRDGETGFLVKPEDIASLKSTILKAYGRREYLEEMGYNGWKMARDEYSWDKIAKRTISAYRDLL